MAKGTRVKALDERDWNLLIRFVDQHRCTPIIGAGASYPTLPLGGQVAQEWADEFDYPLPDTTDLARVAQFLAIDQYEMFPKDELQNRFRDVAPPDFGDPAEPHAALADLNLPIYITTNYDPFMVAALKSRGRDVKREFCRWNRYPELLGHESVFDGNYEPTPESPVVYHLHGHTELRQSMVLTEGDYLDFLIRFSRDPRLLPPPILKALASTSLLFVGYSLEDWNFRVILRGLRGSLGAKLSYPGVAVQLPLEGLSEEDKARTMTYLARYFEQINELRVSIYWGKAREFAAELRDRFKKG